jgi:hypothetical protein
MLVCTLISNVRTGLEPVGGSKLNTYLDYHGQKAVQYIDEESDQLHQYCVFVGLNKLYYLLPSSEPAVTGDVM